MVAACCRVRTGVWHPKVPGARARHAVERARDKWQGCIAAYWLARASPCACALCAVCGTVACLLAQVQSALACGSTLRLSGPAAQPCGSADPAAQRTPRLNGPCGSTDPAAQRTLRLNAPCGSADPAAQRTVRLSGPSAAQRTLCGSADPLRLSGPSAAQRTPRLSGRRPCSLRLRGPCGSANPAAQQTLRLSKPCGSANRGGPVCVLNQLLCCQFCACSFFLGQTGWCRTRKQGLHYIPYRLVML